MRVRGISSRAVSSRQQTRRQRPSLRSNARRPLPARSRGMPSYGRRRRSRVQDEPTRPSPVRARCPPICLDRGRREDGHCGVPRGERRSRGALPLWRSWLLANPHGSRWVDTSVRIANALLDGIDGPPESGAKEAYDAVTRVVVEAPKLADSSGATQARFRAVGPSGEGFLRERCAWRSRASASGAGLARRE